MLGVNATLVAPGAVPSAGSLAAAVGVPSITAMNPASDSLRFDQRGAVSPAGIYVLYVGNTSASYGGYRAVVVLPSGSVQSNAAADFAQHDPEPDVSELYTDIYR